MHLRVAIIYNEPEQDRYQAMGEGKAIAGVLDEVKAVHQASVELGHFVALVPLSPPLERVRDILKNLRVDLVFNLFEGFGGCPETEAMVADMLAELGFPHTGCPGPVLALALDKARTKELLIASGIRMSRYQILSPENLYTFHLTYPCIIKPSGEHASHGLSGESMVNDFASLEKQVIKVSRLFNGKAMVEEFLEGREFNTTVLGNKDPAILTISEIVYSLPPELPRILTFAAKWEEGSPYFTGTTVVCPAQVSDDLHAELGRIALKVFGIMGCVGYARVDFRLDREGNPCVLEVNPNPDISPGSGAARQAEAAGMTYSQFVDKLLKFALERSPVAN